MKKNNLHSLPAPLARLRQALAGLLLAGAVLSAAAATDLTLVTSQANLRAGPGVEHRVKQVIRRGERLQPLAWEDGYLRVRAGASGAEGWLYAAAQGWTEKSLAAALAAGASSAAPAAVAPNAAATAARPPARPAEASAGRPAASHRITLQDIGYRHGHHFEGARSAHAQTFTFPVPREGVIGDARLRIAYRAAAQLDRRSTLRVDINGRPVRLVPLASGGTDEFIDIAVPRSEFEGASRLAVTVRAALIASDDRCFDERQLALHFVDVLPESRLEFTLGAAAASVRAAWAALPATVRLSVPRTPDLESTRALLQLAALLRRDGRRVESLRLPEIGDLVVAPRAELDAALAATPGWSAAGGPAANVLLLRGAQRSALALTHPDGLRLLGLSAPGWQDLLRAGAHGHAPGEAAPAAGDWIGLDALGADLATRYLSGTAEWTLHLTPPRLPGDRRLRTLRASLVATPEGGERHSLLYFHLNGVLQEIRQLDNDGRPHTVSFAIPPDAQRIGDNTLRLVVQRVGAELGDCRGPVASFPVQLLPDSAIQVERHDAPPQRFGDLAATFAGGFDLWLAPDVAAQPEAYLDLLAGLLAQPAIPLEALELRVLDATAGFAPTRAFLLVGQPAGAAPQAPVRFDRGRLRVVDARNRVLLDVDSLPRITVAQLARHNDRHGLWIVPAAPGRLPDPARFTLDADDVAFADDAGIVLTLESKYRSLARVDYPEYVSWFDLLGRYRFWLIALGWTALAVVLLFLYRKAREHRG